MNEPNAGLLDAVKVQIQNPAFIQQLAREIGPHLADRLDNNTERVLSGKEVDTYLGISPSTRIAWVKAGILTCHRVGGRAFYLQSEVLDAVTSASRAGK